MACAVSFIPFLFFSFLSSLHFVPWANIDLSESAASHELVMHYDDLTAAYESHLESKHRQRRPSLGQLATTADRFIDQIRKQRHSC